MKEAKHPFKYSKSIDELIGQKVKKVLFLGEDVLIVTEDLQLFKLSVEKYYDDPDEIIEVETDYSDVSSRIRSFMELGLISEEDYQSFQAEHWFILQEGQKKKAEEEREFKLQQYLKLKAMFEPESKPCQE